MSQSTSSSVAPVRGNGPTGRRWVVVAVALVACAAVATAIVLTNRGHQAATPPGATAGGAGVTASAGGLPSAGAAAATPEIRRQVQTVLQKAEELDRTVWAREVEAQEYEEYFIRIWDDFRAAKDKMAVLEGAAFETLSFGPPAEASEHDWGVRITKFDGSGQTLDASAWRALLGRLRREGYRTTELEFHQSNFEHEPGQPARSVVSTVVHLVNEATASRQALRSKLKVEWAQDRDRPGEGGMFVPRTIEATELTIAQRTGDLAFRPMTLPGGSPRGLFAAENSTYVLAYDLDGDGLSEVLMPGENMLLRNRGGFQFEREDILPAGASGLEAAVIADFDGDGLPDLLCNKGDHIFLVRGVAGGRFGTSPPERVVSLAEPVKTIAALTAGDIDGDGDLDAWFGQYKRPYVDGQMPTPYYDANDGHPAALLVNDGTGRFEDRTEAAGLAAKRHRRTFAASFVDLDGDRDLDLLVNSDFAGLDIYYNDGTGRFTDVTDQVVDERHNFGMGHTFADFNLDGLLDVYTIGMSSTTARRLTSMGLGLEQFPGHQEKRPQMGYGNRLFLAPGSDAPRSNGIAKYTQPAFRDDIARTGWSWGTTAADYDNDGDTDLFIANGLVSGETCRDYCTTYWRRDIYLGSSKEDPVMKSLFAEHGMTPKVSWNGYEHDVLFMSEGGKSYVNIAHLMGVAFEFDGRNTISDDFDGDGRVDLLVVEKVLPRGRYVHILKNEWPTQHNWVGVRLAESAPGFSPIGAEVRVRSARGEQVGRVVTGDSFLAQHANAKHFGIGADDKVESIEVTWPNGEKTRVDNPDVNKWHDVRPGQRPAVSSVNGE
jgi:hypothetical protein